LISVPHTFVMVQIIGMFSSGRRQYPANENNLYIFSYFHGLEVICIS